VIFFYENVYIYRNIENQKDYFYDFVQENKSELIACKAWSDVNGVFDLSLRTD